MNKPIQSVCHKEATKLKYCGLGVSVEWGWRENKWIDTSCPSPYHHSLPQNPLPQTLPPGQTCGDPSSRNPEVRCALQHGREASTERPLFGCSELRHSLGDEGQAAPFPSWGWARRHVRVRKELSLGVGNRTGNCLQAPAAKSTQLSKTRNPAGRLCIS